MRLFHRFYANIMYHLVSPFIKGETRLRITQDFKAFCAYREITPDKSSFIHLFATVPEFRSVIYYWIPNRYRILPRLFLREETGCHFMSGDICGGLVVMHGYGLCINAERIGRNLTIFQNASIVYSKGGKPTIGDNVTICCGAIVAGEVRISDNVTIGAGAVVTSDIPENAVVAGNPAKIVGYNNNRHSSFFFD